MCYPDLCASMINFDVESTGDWFERLFDQFMKWNKVIYICNWASGQTFSCFNFENGHMSQGDGPLLIRIQPRISDLALSETIIPYTRLDGVQHRGISASYGQGMDHKTMTSSRSRT